MMPGFRSKFRKYLRSLRQRVRSSPPRGSLAARMHELELGRDQLARDVAALRVEVQADARRLNAIVDYYETRIDRIYARLSNGLADQTHGAIRVELDSEVNDNLLDLFSSALTSPAVIDSLPMDTILSDRLKLGSIPSPLTLQGFRLNRERGRELGDRIQAFAVGGNVSAGVVVYGPYKSLTPGRYLLEAHIAPAPSLNPIKSGSVALDVYSASEGVVLAKAQLSAKRFNDTCALTVEFEWSPEHSASPVEFRVHQKMKTPFDLFGFSLKLVDQGN